MLPPDDGSIAEAQQLARAVREEALAGEHTPLFLVIQLAAAVEQLADGVLRRFQPDPAEKNS